MTEAVADPVAEDGHHALKWLEGNDRGENRSFAAALDSLRAQQRHLQQSLRDGFDGRREVLEWCHAVDVVSVGETPSDWHSDLARDRWRMACLMADPDDRETICQEVPTDETTIQSVRRKLVRQILTPAFQRSLETLRERVSEFSDTDGVRDATRMKHVAGRPRLHQRAVEQHRLLRATLREPPRVEAEVMAWAEDIIHATEGHLDKGFVETVLDRHGEWWHSLTTGPSVRLEWLLADEVFPALNASLSELATNGNELAETAGRQRGVPDG